jgi:ankyrin repeat protein
MLGIHTIEIFMPMAHIVLYVFFSRHTAKCDIHRLNVFGCNASQWCAMTGNVEILQYLVDQGLDCSILNRNGHSALHKAAIKGRVEMCTWLLRPLKLSGGGLNLRHMQKDDEGFTPMTFASANGHVALGEFIQSKYNEFELELERCLNREPATREKHS